GNSVRELQARTDPGLHRVAWDLGRTSSRQGGAGAAGEPGTERGAGRGGQGRGAGGGGLAGRFGGGPAGQPVPPGAYRGVLTVDGKEYTQGVRVEADPSAPAALQTTEINEDDRGEPPTIDD